jgi:hypothetical protein
MRRGWLLSGSSDDRWALIHNFSRAAAIDYSIIAAPPKTAPKTKVSGATTLTPAPLSLDPLEAEAEALDSLDDSVAVDSDEDSVAVAASVAVAEASALEDEPESDTAPKVPPVTSAGAELSAL